MLHAFKILYTSTSSAHDLFIIFYFKMNFLGAVLFIVFVMQVLSQALGENDILDSLGKNDAEGSESE
jgi:hypothetical protein